MACREHSQQEPTPHCLRATCKHPERKACVSLARILRRCCTDPLWAAVTISCAAASEASLDTLPSGDRRDPGHAEQLDLRPGGGGKVGRRTNDGAARRAAAGRAAGALGCGACRAAVTAQRAASTVSRGGHVSTHPAPVPRSVWDDASRLGRDTQHWVPEVQKGRCNPGVSSVAKRHIVRKSSKARSAW